MPLGINDYHKKLDTRRVGVQKERAYYIPHGSKNAALTLKREYSDRFTLLSGDWDFRFYKSVALVPDSLSSLPAFEEKLYRLLTDDGIAVEVEGSDFYER